MENKEVTKRPIRNGSHEVYELHPMRAQGFDYGNATLAEWQDPNYIYEIKFGGERQLLHVLEDTVAMKGRRVPSVTGPLIEKGEYVPHLTDFKIPSLLGTIIDGELLHPTYDFDLLRSIMGSEEATRAIYLQVEKGWLGYIAYDLLYYKGEDVTALPFQERRALLEEVIAEYQKFAGRYIDTAIQFTPDRFDMKVLFDHLVINGENEGLMRKDLREAYKLCDGSKKSKAVQKLKKVISTKSL